MRVSRTDFNEFWNEILKRDWYIDDYEDLEDLENEKLLFFKIDNWYLSWQGDRKSDVSRLKSLLKEIGEEDTLNYSGKEYILNIGTKDLFQGWQKTKTHKRVLAEFNVLKDKLDDLLKLLKTMDATIHVGDSTEKRKHE